MKLPLLLLLNLILVPAGCAVTHAMGLSLARPDIQIPFIVFFALRLPTLPGAVGSLFAGYVIDAMSGQPTGLYAFAAVIAFLVARLASTFTEGSLITFVPIVAVVDIVQNLLVMGGAVLASTLESHWQTILSALPASAGLTVIAAVLLWPLLSAVDRMFIQQEKGLSP